MNNVHVLPAANENISVKEISRKYQTLELSPHGLPHKSKAPTFDFTQGDWSHTVAEGMSIGCRLNDLVDIDVDLHSAGRLLVAFAPTGFVFGRQGAPATHHLFRVDGPAAKPISYNVTKEFAEKYLPRKPNGDPKVTIVEIRTGKLQTVFPPSTHESGEAIRFETAGNNTFDGDPATLSFAELKRVAGLVAFAGVLSYIWPSSGSRQWAVVASVGVMRKYFKATNEEIRPYMAKLLKGDEELAMRLKGVEAVLKKDVERVAGWKKLQEVFNLLPADIDQFKQWAGGEEYNAEDVQRLKDAYKLVTHAGTTKFWSLRENFNTGREEWVSISESALELENHKASYVSKFLRDPTKPVYRNGFYFDPTTTDWKEGGINLWRGWSIEPKQGDWKTIEHHMLEVLCEANEVYYQYVLKWCAFYVQFPKRPAEVALVFRGAKGTGKGQFLNALGELASKNYQHITSASQLTGRFNDHFHDCIFVFADEAFWAGSKEGEGNLKRMITEPTLSIEGKGDKLFSTANMLHMVIASNDDWPIPATVGERRFAAFQVSEKYKGNKAYFRDLSVALKGDEMRAFFHDLKTMDLGEWHPRDDVPETEMLQEQKVFTGAFGYEGLLREWLERGYLPSTHAAFGDANVVAMDHALIAGGGKKNATRLGRYLKKFAERIRTRRRLRDTGSGKTSDRQIVAYVFPPLADVRKVFDPQADWNDQADWVFEFSEGAPPPVDPDHPQLVMDLGDDSNPPF